MALVEVNWRPSDRELRVFALLLLLFAGTVAWLLHARFGQSDAAQVVGLVLGVISLAGLLLPRLIWPVYLVWMAAALPVGFVVSHVMMGVVFYLVVTPIGLIMRLLGRDPMERVIDKKAKSYWKRRESPSDSQSYFRQF